MHTNKNTNTGHISPPPNDGDFLRFTNSADMTEAVLTANSAYVIAPSERVSSYVRLKFGKDSQNTENQEVKKQSNPRIFLKMMSENRKMSKLLYGDFSSHENFKNSAVEKHLSKGCTCGTYGAFRELGEIGEMHRIGISLCKSKICSTCNSVLSKKRVDAYTKYLSENHRDKYFYHAVFTLKHGVNYRNYDYTEELVGHYRNLRESRYVLSNGQQVRKFWKENIAGGFYNVEIKESNQGKHIHLHVFWITENPLSNLFTETCKEAWNHITGDSEVLFVERIYATIDGQKKYYHPNLPEDEKNMMLKKALPEALKYCLKSDYQTLKDLGFEFLDKFLKSRKRLHSKFGCLYGVKELNIDHKDLDKLEESEKELVSCKTGQIFEKSDTKIVVTAMNNAKIHDVLKPCFHIDTETGEIAIKTEKRHYYTKINPKECAEYRHDDMKSAQKALSTNQNKRWRKFRDVNRT